MFLRSTPYSQNLTFNLSEDTEELEGHCGDLLVGVMVWASLSALCSLVGCPACVAVLWELFQQHKGGNALTPNQLFMLNLTGMDFVFLFFVPFGLCNFFLWEIHSVEMVHNFLYALNLAGRPLLTACICLDCYLAVVHPLVYRNNKSLTPRLVMVGVAWVITLVQGTVATVVDEQLHSPWAMFVYIIALPIIIVCDVAILWALQRSNPAGGDLHATKKKALQVITNSMVMTVTSYVPPVMAYIIGNALIADDKVFECYLAIPVLVTPTAGSTIMPLLYLSNLGKLEAGCCSK